MTEETSSAANPEVGEVDHRTALLEGAIHCLRTVGYARTTARNVVEASGTNLGSIAYHFGSIGALRDAALLEAADRWFRPILAVAYSNGVSESARLEETLRLFLGSLSEQRTLVTTFVEALGHVDRKPTLRLQIREAYERLRQVTAASMGPEESRAEASLMIAIFDGLMIQWLIDPELIGDGGGLVDELTPTLVRITDG
jgi:AcrR family transcriptional regulator